jgi:hypothetical protein
MTGTSPFGIKRYRKKSSWDLPENEKKQGKNNE